MNEFAYTIGVQAYVYGYPTMDLYRTFWENCLDPDRGHDHSFNEFNHSRKLTTPADTWVVTPNSDTLYSRAFLDLTDEPVILQIPPVPDRSYWFPIGDMYHNLNALLAWNTVGEKGGAYALCPPTFSGLLPDGVERVDVRTPFAWMVGRYTVQDEADVPAVNALQDQTHLIPLSQWGAAPSRRPTDPSRYPTFTFEGLQDPAAYFTTLNEMLRRNPPLERDEGLLAFFSEIGLHPRQRFDWDALDADTQAALTRATEAGHAIVVENMRTAPTVVNTWLEAILDADLGHKPGLRAGGAMLGLLYSQKEASTYHVGNVDSTGVQLDGAHAYTLRLDPPPPVDAFWSLTIYSAATRLYVANEIDRYAIGDRTPGVRYGEDGSLDLLIQHDRPDDTANWLPAPAEPFYLILREYSPRAPILTRDWVPPVIERVG